MPFQNHKDKIDHYRLWGLTSPKGERLPPIMVIDGYFGVPEPCEVVGHQGNSWAVIKLADGYHAINGEFLCEMQPWVKNLPSGKKFADVLSDYIVVDIETTGLSPRDHEIIEFAAIQYRYGAKVDEFHTLIHPQKPIPAAITKLTGISNEDVANAPTLIEVISQMDDFIGTTPLIGHNIKTFDAPFIRTLTGLPLDNILIDTLQLAREAFPLLSCHKLQYLNDALQLHKGSAHRAAEDVETTNALLWACLAPRKYESLMWTQYLKDKLSDSKKRRPTEKKSRRNRWNN